MRAHACNFIIAVAAGLFACAPHPVFAQDVLEGAEIDLFAPALPSAAQDVPLPPADEAFAPPVPYAPDAAPPTSLPTGQELVLEASLVADGPQLSNGVTWRVFEAEPSENGDLILVATARGGTGSFQLVPGTYLVHAAFGRAGATKRVILGDQRHVESIVLNAGGLRLDAVVGDDDPLSAEQIAFEISQDGEGTQRQIIVPNAKPGKIVQLPAGTYHVVSRYGTVNAVVRADIQVEPGKLTEATLKHAGAEITLKLVSAAGGEALANTSWTVLTEGGDTVHESVGAFPSLILAEGKYTAVASHQGKAYARDFQIEPGIDRDVEVRLTDLLLPEGDGP